MKTIKKVITLMFLATLLSGCGRMVKSDVSVFHRLPESQRPITYFFIPLEGQKNDLEYLTYQDLMRQYLSLYQFREVEIDKFPDVGIAFAYGIDSGTEKLSSVPIFGQTGVSSSHTQGTINTYGNYGTYSGTTTYTPTYGVVGSQTVSRTEYNRELALYIVESKGLGTENLNILYQGNVKSAGRSSQLPKVMPAMIEALFKEFPGDSGETRVERTSIK
jgi:hypothetical protein